MMQSLLLILTVAFSLWPAFAAANVQWRIINRPYLQGQITEGEDINVFWAYCRPGPVIDLGVGGEFSVGEGNGEAVTLTLSSGGQSVVLNGISLESADTGGAELRTSVSEDDPLFDVLRAGKAITVTGSMDGSFTWEVQGLRSRVANFLRQCR